MYKKQLGLLILAFLVSRILALMAGIHLRYDALLSYWQYLDLETLRHHLLRGIWYDHAQPPFFNLLLGLVLKTAGSAAPIVFAVLLYLISLANTLLLFTILTRLVRHPRLPFYIALLYMLSPALLIFETELFYTTFISLLLLLSAFFLIRLKTDRRWTTIAGICAPLAIACLTRSMFHLLWLIVIAGALLYLLGKDPARKALSIGLALSILLVAGWYTHEKMVFGQFSSSSWLGMNLARTVFHDHPVTDSSRIEAYEPFSPIQTYTRFIDPEKLKKYAGLNDRDLFGKYKNDTLLNATHAGYIQVSKQYMKAATDYIRRHPAWYLQNVAQS
ncbi:MAG TPA: hypothetical protein VG605_03430, partial [Puia sp.]|nr:hypothetical protein [Puia sp.]